MQDTDDCRGKVVDCAVLRARDVHEDRRRGCDIDAKTLGEDASGVLEDGVRDALAY